MAKFQSPLLGYNNNVRHRGRVFHIQTEDSGVNHPHIITHLFMDGGRILKSVKRSYAEHVGSDNLSETVRVLMKEQHKAMFVALRDGQFDHLVEGTKKASGAVAAPAVPPAAPAAKGKNEAAPAPAPEPRAPTAHVTPPAPQAKVPPPAKSDVSLNDVAVASVVKVSSDQLPAAAKGPNVDSRPSPITKRGTGEAPAPRTVRHEETAPVTIDEGRRAVASHYASSAEPPLPPELEALLRDELTPPATEASARAKEEAEPKTMREPERRRSAQELTLDFDALERDSGPSPIFQHSDLPPPPKNLFTKEPRTGTYSAVEADVHHDTSHVTPTRSQPPASRTPQQPPVRQASTHPRSPSQKPPADARHAPARPAAIFGAASKEPTPSIFSDDLVSDKSLDEVILSYLAEDLDPPRRK